MKKILISIIAIACAIQLKAEVTLPNILGSNMVIQRNTGTTIWGNADANEAVEVSFRGQTKQTQADDEGHWKTTIQTGEAGGPFEIMIKANNTITLENILVGDVWVCSGQSNMEWPLAQTNQADAEIANANYPNIRLFKVENNASPEPAFDTAPAQWRVCSPQTVAPFSAVGYYFGKNIHLETNVPIGLISSNWGGTIIETWISDETVQNDEFMAEWVEGLKTIDYDALVKKQKKIFETYKAKLEEVQKPDFTHQYLANEYNDSEWFEFSQPQLWESQANFEKFDGIVWYRKSIDIPQSFNTQNASISLARIDDTDIAWINGKRVGETFNMYNKTRQYSIDQGVLKPGKNQIVLRVEDYGGGGGFHGSASDMYLFDGNTTIPLSGNWKIMKDETATPPNPLSPNATGIMPNQFPTLLFNGMIHPLLQFAVKGAIWYQGESNADNLEEALRYEQQMRLMIEDWRKHWNNPDLSFYMVQLANYKDEAPSGQNDLWPLVRQAQAHVANDTGVEMACIIDIGEANDIHPRNKKDVGYRLALNALHLDYGKDRVYNGPRYESIMTNGASAIIHFDTMGSDLTAKSNQDKITGFAAAGPDKVFYPAEAKIIGPKTIEVISNSVKNIKAIRYLWADNPGEVTLYNSHKLPAEPFRTDNWEY